VRAVNRRVTRVAKRVPGRRASSRRRRLLTRKVVKESNKRRNQRNSYNLLNMHDQKNLKKMAKEVTTDIMI
jgi:hypothetical protein